MKKEMKVVLFFSVLSLVFLGIIDLWETVFVHIPKIKEYVLVVLLLLIQTQILNGLKGKFMDSNHSLIAAKRKLFLFYTQTTDQFHSLYNNVSKKNRLSAISFLLAHLGFSELNDRTYEMGKKWLEKRENIPFDNLPKRIDPRNKRRIKNKISEFQTSSSRYEDIFFGCLSGKIMTATNTQSIIELILVWVSYFYFLTGVFNIKLDEHTTLVIAFLAITIADIGKHYLVYKKEVDNAVKTFNEFYDQMHHMHDDMNDKDCLYVNIEGENIPYAVIPGSAEEIQIEATQK